MEKILKTEELIAKETYYKITLKETEMAKFNKVMEELDSRYPAYAVSSYLKHHGIRIEQQGEWSHTEEDTYKILEI